MDCPVCEAQKLEPQLTAQGVEVDQCANCGSMWLDKGEVYRLVQDPVGLSSKLSTAYASAGSSDLLSPRSGEAMEEIDIDGAGVAYRSPHSDGLWMPVKTLYKLLSGKAAPAKAPGQFGRKGASDAPQAEPAPRPTFGRRRMPTDTVTRGGAAVEKLMSLPNLGLRSAGTLIGLYGLLTVVVIAATEYFGAPLETMMISALIMTMIQFLLAPFLMDLSLRWFYNTRFVEFNELPRHLQTFANKVARQNEIKTPRFAIMNDGAPQAFTYGHTPNNARIVLSQGIFELLDEQEVEAVTAHEMGHAVHWDILLMTFAQLVPLILYYVYRSALEGAKGKGKKSKGNAYVVIGAYLLYIVSEYVVLWFSRTREYHADRFAGDATGKPALLSSALAKIAYGLAARSNVDASGDEDRDESKNKRDPAKAIGALGIFDASTATSLAMASQSAHPDPSHVDKDNLKRAMRWDLWNPWAAWYELNSTHPLTANRLEHLANQSRVLGQEPFITFNEQQPESYWDEFAIDLFMHLLPLIGAAIGFCGAFFVLGLRDELSLLGWTLMMSGPCAFLRLAFSYRGDFFPGFSIAGLLKVVKVSSVRPVPCTLQGTIIGRGVPGFIASEDFVMRDDTGIIFLDIRQPLAIWEFFFGLLKAEKFHGQEVVVEGWYRRAPVPYIEIKSIELDGEVTKSWYRFFNIMSAVIITFVGMFLTFGNVMANL